jgi:hypothetical protein
MEQVYTIWKPIKISFLVGLVSVVLYFAFILIKNWNVDSTNTIWLTLILVSVCILVFINTVKSKIIISDKSIRQINLFSKKELEFKNIRGFRINGRTIVVAPTAMVYPQLIVYNYVRIDGECTLLDWLEKNLKDLDKRI